MLLALGTAVPLSAEELQDPTRPSYATAELSGGKGQTPTSANLVLNAIRFAPGQRSALINNRSVKVGESLGEARVIAIDRGSVRLLRGTELVTLQLLPNSVKQVHKANRR